MSDPVVGRIVLQPGKSRGSAACAVEIKPAAREAQAALAAIREELGMFPLATSDEIVDAVRKLREAAQDAGVYVVRDVRSSK